VPPAIGAADADPTGSNSPVVTHTKRRLSDLGGNLSNKKKRLRREGSSTGLVGGENTEERRPIWGDEERDRQRLGALLSTFSDEQMQRYESFRRSHFAQAKVKKLIQRVSGLKGGVSSELAVAMGGIAKIFAGELIEYAREDMGDFNGPIHPLHIRNAFRRLKKEGKVPYLNTPVRGLLQ